MVSRCAYHELYCDIVVKELCFLVQSLVSGSTHMRPVSMRIHVCFLLVFIARIYKCINLDIFKEEQSGLLRRVIG